jgi:regulator of protease activity HflC (stomatin/prohibitin superfamily)
MAFIVLLAILVVVGLIAIGAALLSSTPGFGVTATLCGFGVALSLLFVGCSAHQVENGHIGIVKEFGKLVGTTGEGVTWTAPWQSLAEVSVQNELKTYEMTQTNSAVSSDSQAVFLIVQVNYLLQRDKAVDLYRETGGDFIHRILDPAVYQNTKAVTARYKAIDFAKNRDQIRTEIEEEIGKEVEPHGLQVQNVSLKNVDFTDALSKAIEETVEAEQQAKRAEAQVLIKKAEADQVVATARGDALAQRLRQRTLTPQLLMQQAIDKLNPAVQYIVCPPRSYCIPNAPPGVLPQPGE